MEGGREGGRGERERGRGGESERERERRWKRGRRQAKGIEL